MSFKDKIGDAWDWVKDSGASIGSAFMNWDPKAMGWVHDVNRFASGTPLGRVADSAGGAGLSAVNSVMNTATRPASTFYQVVGSAGQGFSWKDAQPLFDPDVWKQSWERSAPSYTDETGQHEGISYGQALVGAAVPGTAGPNVKPEARYKFFHDTWYGQLSSGAVDLFIALEADPLYAAGKIGKARSLEKATIKAGDVSSVVAASAGEIQASTLSKTAQRKLGDFHDFLIWTSGKSASEIALHPAMKANAEGGTYAYLLSQADKIADPKHSADVKRTLFGAALGDDASIQALKKNQDLLANELYRLSSPPATTKAVQLFNHADGNMKAITAANAADPVEITSQHLRIVKEIERLQRVIDAKATSDVIRGTGAQRALLDRELAGLQQSEIYLGLGNRPIRVLAGQVGNRLPGHISLRDPAAGFDTLNDYLKQAPHITGEQRRKILDKWVKAASDGDRNGVVREAEAMILKTTGEYYGVKPKDILRIAELGETRRNAWTGLLKQRLYSAAPDAKYVHVTDPEEDVIHAISRPLLRSQIEEFAPILDPKAIDQSLRAGTRGRVLDNVGAYFGPTAYDAAEQTYKGLDWLGYHVDSGLQSITKWWKASVLLPRGLAYGVRVQVDSQMRLMAHMGVAMWAKGFFGDALPAQVKYMAARQATDNETALKYALQPWLKKMYFSDEEADKIIRTIASQNGASADLMGELSNQMINKMRGSGQWGSVYPGQDEWLGAWTRAVNNQIRNSPTAMKFVAGSSLDDVKRFVMNDPAARKEWLEIAEANNKDMDAWLRRVEAHVEHYLPKPEMREAALKGNVYTGKGSNADKWFPNDDAKMIVHGESFSPYAGHPISEFFNAAREKMYQYVADAPETTMARMPLYLFSYNRNLKAIINRLEKNLTADGEITQEAFETARKQADRMARREIKEVLFDSTDVSNLAHTMRFVSPFFAAWEDMMKKWGSLFYENPAALERFRQGWNLPENMGIATDEYGNLINSQGQHTDPNTGEVVTDPELIGRQDLIRIPTKWVPDSWLKKMGIDSTDPDHPGEFRINKKSFNIIFQGEPWWLPGFGPLVQIPANALVKSAFTDDVEDPVIRWLLPRGITNDSAVEQMLPAWARHLGTSERWAFGDENEWKQQAALVMREEWNKFRAGQRDDPTLHPEEISNKVKNYFFLRLALGLSAPVSVRPSAGQQFYIDQAHIYQQKWGQVQQSPEYKAALKAYTEQYGKNGKARLLYDHPEYKSGLERFREDFPEYFNLAVSISTNETGIVASDKAVSAAKRWRKEIAAAPELGWVIVGPDNAYGFSSAAHTWELGTEAVPGTGKTFRSYEGDPIEALKRAEREKGWAEFQKSRTALNLELERRGLHSLQQKGAADLKAAWGKYVDDLAKWNVHWAEDYQQNDESKALSTLNQALKVISGSKSLAERQDMQAIQLYAQARNALMAELEKRGGTLAAEKNADLEAAWHSYVQQLIQWSPGFEQIWSRALQNDNLTLPTAGAYPQE